VFSSIDHGGRYAFANQPLIARWNLARLAEALLPLIADADDEAAVQRAVAAVTEVIDSFPQWYDTALRRGQRAKLGLQREEGADAALADDWLALLHAQSADFTLAWRRLADAAEGNDNPLRALLVEPAAADAWLLRWRQRFERDGTLGSAGRALAMRQVSPWVIARNHRVEEALAAASTQGDLGPFERLLAALRRPFDDSSPEAARYAEPAPAAVPAAYRTFCGT
jgi:serine/tyrosine/threonine adenylyltransferase